MSTALTQAPATPQTETDRRRWAILAVVLFSAVLDLLDSTITNIAAPTIATDLHGGDALVQWLGAGYALAMGVLLVVGGRLGDKFGRRRLFLIGLTGFTLASVACGLATGPASVIGFRLLQGAFGALVIPQGFGILGAVFPPNEIGKAFGVFAPCLGLSAISGPVLAGLLIDSFGWRSMFLINIALGGLAIALAARLLPRDAGDRTVTVDVPGSGLLAATMLGLLYGLIDGSNHGWTLVAVLSLTVGALLFALFCLRQRTAAGPLIEPSLLKNRGFTSGLILGLVFNAAVTGLLLVLSLFFQGGLHRTPTQTSLGLAPVAAGIILASLAAHRLMARLGRTLILIGLLLTLTGTLSLLVLIHTTDPTAWTLLAPVFVTGLGLGSCFGTVYEVTLGDVGPKESGSASGALSAVAQLANSIGAAAITTVYFHTAGSPTSAAVHSLATVAVGTLACCALVRLLPRRARPRHH
ncbi:DHA2 family efflux MFS transporter permease subunit [Streptomyces noursei]|uniref:DHA2 family efflux MFS transporter permease subunit n=1 Tax=Streptomyces noursei TaxID=1971 RepID=UPI001678F7F9|nr:DHA2 family efflux MFS transporter permease subunit [Streptomyces noursei]MCZ1016379.1 DHA2 family efflux MFS transporter permease subunit [Streptomyces noursei]GGX00120.1 putative actinorhodin transporter [Streptomyces noursei]